MSKLKQVKQFFFCLGLAGLTGLAFTSKANALTYNLSSDIGNGSITISDDQDSITAFSFFTPFGSFDLATIDFDLTYWENPIWPGQGPRRYRIDATYQVGFYERRILLNDTSVTLREESVSGERRQLTGPRATWTLAAAEEVPFDFDPAFGAALGLPLFIGLRYLKKRVASKKLKFNSTGTVS